MHKQIVFVTIVASLLASSCNRGNDSALQAKNSQADADVPMGLRNLSQRDIGSICMLDSINGQTIRGDASFPPDTMARLQGWARIADAGKPLPPVVYLVLRPNDSSEGRDVYLEMGRMPRPDIGGSDPTLEMIGFEGQAKLPAEGTYKVQVLQATKAWKTLCTVPATLSIGQREEAARPLFPIMEDRKPDATPTPEGKKGDRS